MWVTGGTRLPRLVADQPVKRLGLDGEEVGDFQMLGDPPKRNATGGKSARGVRGLRRAGRCQDASFRGPVMQRTLREQPDRPRSKTLTNDASQTGVVSEDSAN